MAMMGDQFSAGTNPMMMQGGPEEMGEPPMMQNPGEEMGEQPMAQGPSAEESQNFEINAQLNELNIATTLKKKDENKGTSILAKIGEQVVKDYETDEDSRSEWMSRNETWMKLATQVVEKKTFPWDGAANVKFPLLSMAALQFSARAYSSLVPSFDVVKAKVIGPDADGKLTDVANTLSTHMSYQVLYEMEGWEDDMDTLCFVLPIVGVMFKKTYHSEKTYTNCSELVHAKDLVVNYYTKSLSKASRYTHILYYTPNEVKEKQLYGQFLEYDEDFGPGQGGDRSVTGDSSTSGQTAPGADDEDTPRKILEQYRRLDLDEDGYKEPYVVTVDYETRRVLRITPNFHIEDVDRDNDGKIRCITAKSWFTKYGFLPNPDGGFYDLGFGLLLGGINEAVNTLTNQMLDSGTLNNLNAGFLAKGLRVGGKNEKFKPGEWKIVNAIGDDLRKGIVPLPANPPSPVLFQLLGTLAQAGKELASVAEIFTGKMPGQNTPAATTMATIEQGLKVFTSIYKRIYRSMQQEFMKLFELNRLYMPTETVRFVSETNGYSKEHKVSRFDYQGIKVKIIPAADPNMVSETQKMMKIQGLHELVQLGTLNVKEMTKQALTYQGQENIAALMQVEPPPPPLEITLLQMELADKDKDRQLEMMKLQSESRKRESEIVLNLAKAKQLGDEQGAMMLEHQLEQEKASAEIQTKWMDLLFKREEHQMDMQHKQEEHSLNRETKMAEASINLQTAEATASQNIKANEEKNRVNIEGMKQKQALQAKGKNDKPTNKGRN